MKYKLHDGQDQSNQCKPKNIADQSCQDHSNIYTKKSYKACLNQRPESNFFHNKRIKTVKNREVSWLAPNQKMAGAYLMKSLLLVWKQ